MIKVFEAFAGYGSQRMALKNLNIPHEIVGISEIDGDVILSYAAIHEDLLRKKDEAVDLSDEEMRDYLKSINVPLDYKTFDNKANLLKGEKLKCMFLANKLAKNYGDIRRIEPQSLPDFDLFTYSFPCQDISVAGYQNGLTADSGTRSSLLWECCKIIEAKRPQYLMMENVKNLVGKNHINSFLKFLSFLETLGYKNYWKVLNARDYGIPQNRERVFCVSIHNSKKTYVFPLPTKLTAQIDDYLELSVGDKYYLKNNQVTKSPIKQDYIYCLDSNYWKGVFLDDFFLKRKRQLVSGKCQDDGMYPARRLTPLETWRFMGCADDDFYKAKAFVSDTSLYRQSGNSIVVQVLEAVFSKMFDSISQGDEMCFSRFKIMSKEGEAGNMDTNKQKIIEIFRETVKGKMPDVTGFNINHDGKTGHWLERQFKISANANNSADILGYELKNETSSKTTFGDWSANRYIHKQGDYINCFQMNKTRQDDFCRIFGKPNEAKNNRYSWSGSPCPKINRFNDFGQILLIDDNLDIVVKYFFSKDMRPDKNIIMPAMMQIDNLEVARWFGIESPSRSRQDKCIKDKLEDKFNDCGWFTCKTDLTGTYQKICFGNPMTYDNWIKLVDQGIVFLDSGMYQGNNRPYSQWRAENKLWDSLIVEIYE